MDAGAGTIQILPKAAARQRAADDALRLKW
jgi:hypothetical protein